MLKVSPFWGNKIKDNALNNNNNNMWTYIAHVSTN